MKALITIVLILGLYWVGRSISNQYKAKQAKDNPVQPVAVAQLEGMPSQLEASLQAAEAKGAPILKAWLEHNRKLIRDPRLAEIELNYVALVSRPNHQEAKKVFQTVKRRIPKSSPLYARVKRHEATYGN